MRIVETVTVSGISDNSLASGVFEQNDIIRSVTLNGTTKEITRKHMVIDIMLKARVGDTVQFTVIRNGSEKNISITVTENCLAAY